MYAFKPQLSNSHGCTGFSWMTPTTQVLLHAFICVLCVVCCMRCMLYVASVYVEGVILQERLRTKNWLPVRLSVRLSVHLKKVIMIEVAPFASVHHQLPCRSLRWVSRVFFYRSKFWVLTNSSGSAKRAWQAYVAIAGRHGLFRVLHSMWRQTLNTTLYKQCVVL